MNTFHGSHIRLPKLFFVATEYILNEDMSQLFKEKALDVDSLGELINEAEEVEYQNRYNHAQLCGQLMVKYNNG